MGGHESGEIASRMAVDIFAEHAAKGAEVLRAPGRKRSQTRAMAQDFVFEWTQVANAAIHRRGGGSGAAAPKARMGTTLALAFFVSDFAVVANVGDSRVYRVRAGAIERLTEDHVVIADARRAATDPRPPRKRKFVTKALGTRNAVDPDIHLFDVLPGDVYLLCSDGLTDLVTDEEILETTRRAREDLRQAVRSLIDLANKRGGTDNVTVVVGEVVREEGDDASDQTDVLPIEKDEDA